VQAYAKVEATLEGPVKIVFGKKNVISLINTRDHRKRQTCPSSGVLVGQLRMVRDGRPGLMPVPNTMRVVFGGPKLLGKKVDDLEAMDQFHPAAQTPAPPPSADARWRDDGTRRHGRLVHVKRVPALT